jgi:yecA family protein
VSNVIHGHRPSDRDASHPLTPEEIDELHDYLISQGADVQGFEALDGFLTAISLVPDTLLPAVWYRYVFEENEDDEAIAERLAEADHAAMFAMILRHWRTVRRRLARGGAWRVPCGQRRPGDDWEIDWALGIGQGKECARDHWEDLPVESRTAALEPVIRLAEQARVVDGEGTLLSTDERGLLMRKAVAGMNVLYAVFRWKARAGHGDRPGGC